MFLIHSYLAATKAPIIIANTVILIPQEKVFLQNKVIKKYIHVPLIIHKDLIFGKRLNLKAKKYTCFL